VTVVGALAVAGVDRGGPPPAAATVFGPSLPTIERYAELLATAGIERGLLGPREADRLWERHLLNCGVVAPLLRGPLVLDLGSGAGLPGLVLAVARPDLTFLLVDATRRRVTFLEEAVEQLGLPNVSARWARAEELAGAVAADEVVARAVAPLDRLVAWSLPLLRPAGRLLAIKGATATDEVAATAKAISRAGGGRPRLLECGTGVLHDPVAVVEVARVGRARSAR
jgi:16S rRNA (guanine527-N7)-methyltransferase